MAIALFASSCNDFLVKEPILSQSTEITLSTFDGLNSALAGAYSPLASSTWYGPGFVFEAEMRSGNGKKPTEGDFDSGRYSGSYNISYNPSSTSGLWGYGYFVISAANNVLANLEGKEGGDVTAADINNLKAEALFLRALSHFDMVRLYAQPYGYNQNGPGVPVVLATDPAGMPARGTVAETYNQIVADLKEAESLMSDDYKRSGADYKAAATKPAIQALLSRVYLYMEDWTNAAAYATKIIENSNFKMWTADEYAEAWTQNVGSSEVVFEVFGDKTNAYDAYWESPMWMSSPNGYADCGTSTDLVKLYEAEDVRNQWQQAEGYDHLYWTIKYAGKGMSTPDANNTVVLRLSEMYLNRAEAYVNMGQLDKASADLNVITAARNASAYGAAVTKEDVYNERRKELAWEGHLWFDLSRWGKGITRVDYVGDPTNQNVAAHSYMFALPIPKRELDVNENLVQNEGY